MVDSEVRERGLLYVRVALGMLYKSAGENDHDTNLARNRQERNLLVGIVQALIEIGEWKSVLKTFPRLLPDHNRKGWAFRGEQANRKLRWSNLESYLRQKNNLLRGLADATSLPPVPHLNPNAPIFSPSSSAIENPFASKSSNNNIQTTWDATADHAGIRREGNVAPSSWQQEKYSRHDNMLPFSKNCSLHIFCLPVCTSLKDIYDTVVEGKIFSSRIFIPKQGRSWNNSATAALAFVDRKGAEDYLAKSKAGSGIMVQGSRIEVRWDKQMVPALPEKDWDQSRVLKISGPHNMMSADYIENVLRRLMAFDLVDKEEWVFDNGRRSVELTFSSIYGESRIALKCFREWATVNRLPSREYGADYYRDPCDPLRRNDCPRISKTKR